MRDGNRRAKSKSGMSDSKTAPCSFRSRFRVLVWTLGFGVLLGSPFYGFGMLGPETDSFLLLSADRSKALVMSRPARSRRSGDDAGRWQALPNGRKVDLYTQFPSNGVYRLPDLAPVYFLDWFADSNWFALSPNLEGIAKFNIYATIGNLTNAAAPKPKAIRFFNQGVEVRSYLASELVENPVGGTIPPRDDYSIGYWAWLDSFGLLKGDRLEVKTVPRGLFLFGRELVICRGNRLVFDLHSGELLSAERPFARLATTVLVCLGIGGLAAITVLIVRHRRNGASPS